MELQMGALKPACPSFFCLYFRILFKFYISLVLMEALPQSVYRLNYGLDDRGSISGGDNDGIFSFVTEFRLA